MYFYVQNDKLTLITTAAEEVGPTVMVHPSNKADNVKSNSREDMIVDKQHIVVHKPDDENIVVHKPDDENIIVKPIDENIADKPITEADSPGEAVLDGPTEGKDSNAASNIKNQTDKGVWLGSGYTTQN